MNGINNPVGRFKDDNYERYENASNMIENEIDDIFT